MGNHEERVRYGRGRRFSLSFFLAAVVLSGVLADSALPLAAQSNGSRPSGQSSAPRAASPASSAGSDSLAAALARADSVRATLVQPPGSYDGVRAGDLVRAPFQLLGAGLAVVAFGVGATYTLADEYVLEPGRRARD